MSCVFPKTKTKMKTWRKPKAKPRQLIKRCWTLVPLPRATWWQIGSCREPLCPCFLGEWCVASPFSRISTTVLLLCVTGNARREGARLDLWPSWCLFNIDGVDHNKLDWRTIPQVPYGQKSKSLTMFHVDDTLGKQAFPGMDSGGEMVYPFRGCLPLSTKLENAFTLWVIKSHSWEFVFQVFV